MKSRLAGLIGVCVGLVALGLALPAAPAAGTAAPGPEVAARGVPVLAYYYIWFDHGSWRRAKRDYPLLGRYSSDDASVMRTHIREAKQAGIDGFIVSWKHTPSLDRRLTTLVNVAESEHFSLSIIYQGLDFYRRPLEPERVGIDLKFFARSFARRAPFRMFPKPLVIWSGTWEYRAEDIQRMTDPVRDRLTVLASEKNAAGYERVAAAVDGDAYYWSSVNPDTYPAYQNKLDAMSQVVHDHGGMWIAPAAVGFDARAIGGTTTVLRNGGRTLLEECAAARNSRPDAVGIISWNEFSENSHVEPSVRYGRRSLDAVTRCSKADGARVRSDAAGAGEVADSSSPGHGPATGLFVAPLSLMALAIALFVVIRRGRTRTDADERTVELNHRGAQADIGWGSLGRRPVSPPG